MADVGVIHVCGHLWRYHEGGPRCHYCGKRHWASDGPCPGCDKPNHIGGRCLVGEGRFQGNGAEAAASETRE